MGRLSQGNLWWAQCNHKVVIKREQGGYVMTEGEKQVRKKFQNSSLLALKMKKGLQVKKKKKSNPIIHGKNQELDSPLMCPERTLP